MEKDTYLNIVLFLKEMSYLREVLDKYCSLFLHNHSLYIIHNGRTWLTEKIEVTKELIQKHLERKITIGLQPQKEDGTVKWATIDFDTHNNEPVEEIRENLQKTKENLSKVNIDSHIEQSGRGYHLWIFFEEPIQRAGIERLIKQFIYHSAELYAGKQKIRIPLGSYQKDKTIFCGFLDNNLNLIENQEEYLMNINPSSIRTIQDARQKIRDDKSLIKIKPISKTKIRKIKTNEIWFTFNKENKTTDKPEIDKSKAIGLTANSKHKFILQLLFDMNLSPREIRNIKVKDIRIEEQILEIAKWKGKERKMLLILGHLINSFREYMNDKQPKGLLLMSARGKRYNQRTIEKIKENGINRLAPEK